MSHVIQSNVNRERRGAYLRWQNEFHHWSSPLPFDDLSMGLKVNRLRRLHFDIYVCRMSNRLSTNQVMRTHHSVESNKPQIDTKMLCGDIEWQICCLRLWHLRGSISVVESWMRNFSTNWINYLCFNEIPRTNKLTMMRLLKIHIIVNLTSTRLRLLPHFTHLPVLISSFYCFHLNSFWRTLLFTAILYWHF